MNISTVTVFNLPSIQIFYSWLPLLTLVLLVGLFLLGLVVFGVVANLTVCIVMIRGGRFRKHLSNFMLFHLAITDIVYRLIVVPSRGTVLLFPLETKPTIFCKVTKTFIYMFNTAVFTSLVIIAFDRLQSITRPFKRLRHKPKFYRYILAVWGYSIVCALPQMFNAEIGTHAVNFTIHSNKTGTTSTYGVHLCTLSNVGSSRRIVEIIYFMLGFFVPLLIITVAYSKIAVFLWKKSRNRMVNQAALKSKGKALRMLVLVVVGFVVCLGAPQVFDLMKSFGLKDQVAMDSLAVVLQLSSSLINPIIYGFYSAEFKHGLKHKA